MARSPRSVFQRLALVLVAGLALAVVVTTLGPSDAHGEAHRVMHEVERRIESEVERKVHANERAIELASAGSAGTVFLRESFSVRDGERLDLNLGSDDVVVETVRGTTAEVLIEGTGRDAREVFERRAYQVFHEAGRLHVRTKPSRNDSWQRGRSYRASFTVTVRIPERFDARIDVGSGDVRIEDLAGDLSLDTGSGEVRIGSVRGGEIRIDTGSGDVEADRLDGSSVHIDTGSGEVTVGSLAGRASIDTGSGDVAVSTDGGHDLEVSTGSGEVEIVLPRAAGAELAIRSRDVDIDDDFAFDGRSDRRSTRGTLGAGGSRIDVSTGSGDVALRAR